MQSLRLCAFVVGAFFAPVAYNFYFYYIAGLAVGARQALQAFGDPVATGTPVSSGPGAKAFT